MQIKWAWSTKKWSYLHFYTHWLIGLNVAKPSKFYKSRVIFYELNPNSAIFTILKLKLVPGRLEVRSNVDGIALPLFIEMDLEAEISEGGPDFVWSLRMFGEHLKTTKQTFNRNGQLSTSNRGWTKEKKSICLNSFHNLFISNWSINSEELHAQKWFNTTQRIKDYTNEAKPERDFPFINDFLILTFYLRLLYGFVIKKF